MISCPRLKHIFQKYFTSDNLDGGEEETHRNGNVIVLQIGIIKKGTFLKLSEADYIRLDVHTLLGWLSTFVQHLTSKRNPETVITLFLYFLLLPAI